LVPRFSLYGMVEIHRKDAENAKDFYSYHSIYSNVTQARLAQQHPTALL